ncbi:MAG: helix-turn-helix domain-containing protein [Thermodesulfobacteriota bacterium]|nr:helix-turn-helix domain-containing protein [Thermodesulfobacteriota bacterium]
MGQEESDNILTLFEQECWPAFLGGEKFVSWVKATFSQQKQDRQVPESFQLAPDRSLIIREVCQFYNVSEQDLLTARRGRSNVPRDVAIYLCRVLRNDTLKKIGTNFGMTGYGPAGNAVNRVKNKMLKNRELGQEVEKIKNRLYNSRKSLQ